VIRGSEHTASGKAPTTPGDSAPQPINPITGQHGDHWVLPESERAKGYVRPVRTRYRHEPCSAAPGGFVTTMGYPIAETFARDPKFYGSTFCVGCRQYLPVGEFEWEDGSVVGS